MATYTVRWVAALDATVSTQYKIYSDEAASGTYAEEATVSASDRGDGQYTPYSTTLNGAITATAASLVFTDATNFANGEYVSIENEIIKLGGKSGNTFASCERGIGGSVKVAHDTLTTIYKAHESTSITIATFGSRKIIRVKVTRLDNSLESVASESNIIKPTNPPSNNYTTLYGILRSAQGSPLSAVDVTMTIASSGAYQIGTGDVLYKQTEEAVTDADGYFEFFVPRTAKTDSDKEITLAIGTGSGLITWSVESVPDVDSINFIET